MITLARFLFQLHSRVSILLHSGTSHRSNILFNCFFFNSISRQKPKSWCTIMMNIIDRLRACHETGMTAWAQINNRLPKRKHAV